MRFLIKAAFWLTLAFVFLPVFEKKGQDAAGHAQQAAHQPETAPSVQHPVPPAAVPQDMNGGIHLIARFCVDNPDLCTTGESMMTTAGLAARDVAGFVYQYLDEKFGQPRPPAAVGMEDDIDTAIRRAFGEDVDASAETGSVAIPKR
ncbi:MAG: DUF5330 domain-containing protein [Phyllobacterium sp.]